MVVDDVVGLGDEDLGGRQVPVLGAGGDGDDGGTGEDLEGNVVLGSSGSGSGSGRGHGDDGGGDEQQVLDVGGLGGDADVRDDVWQGRGGGDGSGGVVQGGCGRGEGSGGVDERVSVSVGLGEGDEGGGCRATEDGIPEGSQLGLDGVQDACVRGGCGCGRGSSQC